MRCIDAVWEARVVAVRESGTRDVPAVLWLRRGVGFLVGFGERRAAAKRFRPKVLEFQDGVL